MTTIEYAFTDTGFALRASGHTGFAEKGKDIVCAAISALLSTVSIGAVTLEQYSAIKVFRNNLDIGFCHFNFYINDLKVAQCFFTPYITALKSIAQQYPKNVTVNQVAIHHLSY